MINITFTNIDDKRVVEILNADKYKGMLQDLDNFLRDQVKYNDKLSDDYSDAFDEVRSTIRDMCIDAGIDLWD